MPPFHTQAADFFRALLGRETTAQRLQAQEQRIPNGVIRQTLDPDQALAQQRLAAPSRPGDTASLAQYTFLQQGSRSVPQQDRAPASSLAALHQRLDVLRQVEQVRHQQRGPERGY